MIHVMLDNATFILTLCGDPMGILWWSYVGIVLGIVLGIVWGLYWGLYGDCIGDCMGIVLGIVWGLYGGIIWVFYYYYLEKCTHICDNYIAITNK